MKKNKNNKKTKNKILIFSGVLVFIIVIAVVLFLLGKDNNELNKTNDDKKDTKINKVDEKKLNIVDVNSKSRPYAIMINNISTARPYHSGLQEALIIYEMIVEGGITRLMAVYKDANINRIGSVRSARHYFLDYALENDAIYVHIGWSPQAKNDISDLRVNNINGLYDSAFIRDKSLKISKEHTSFTSISKITNAASKKKYRMTSDTPLLLNYSIDEIDLSTMEGAIPANNISLTYSASSKSSYVYDANSKRYLRSVNGIAHKDYITGKQYSFKNIITYQVSNSSISKDKKNRQDINNIGKGNGHYITNGYAVPITWEKSSRSAQTVYRYMNGKEIDVNDGNTFIQIQPKSKELIIN